MKRWIAGIAFTLVAGLGLLVANIGPLVDRMMTPTEPFAAQTPPPAPDYADASAWSALPDREDAGDPAPTGVAPADQTHAPVDVFYVHPTSYVANRWNGPYDDATLNADTDRVATGIQATAFNGCCAVYAPRYRQANGTVFTHPSDDGDRALDFAYQDVRRAFDEFQRRRGADRPFVLAGHSQGAILAFRLLREVVSGTPLRDQLVMAVLPGAGITAAGLAEASPDTPACSGPDDLRCVVAWNARGPAWRQGRYDLVGSDTRAWLCTNPLSWRTDDVAMPASANHGAVFLEAEDRSPRPGFADAQCVNGVLIVRELQHAPRDFMSSILDYVMGPENYHPMEYQLFFSDLRANVEHRAALILRRS